jgi:hypothetical protein
MLAGTSTLTAPDIASTDPGQMRVSYKCLDAASVISQYDTPGFPVRDQHIPSY